MWCHGGPVWCHGSPAWCHGVMVALCGVMAALRGVMVVCAASPQIWVLICTDLMSQGMDFKGVNMVINYDFPPQPSATSTE